MKHRHILTTAAALSAFLLASTQQGAAQNVGSIEKVQKVIKPGQTVIVTTGGVKTRGQMIEATSGLIRIKVDRDERSIPVPEIQRVERERRGGVPGAVIGGAIGAPFGIALASRFQNEGGSGASAVIPIAIG
ncbi:MAG TPA: hypothetical protein VFY29_20965, partial [Terriglobia bacterium]|nr:hypothetical protein [Terriglobia bacterium]